MAKKKSTTNNGGDLGFEAELFKAADKIRANMEPSDYKHVVLGLIFLKHISDGFMAKRAELERGYPDGVEDEDEYRADNIFWVPKPARWSHLQANAKQAEIGRLIDEAMLEIEKVNPSLKGVLPKDYARPALNPVMLGELIDLISGIGFKEDSGQSRDVLGRVYEYFLGQFAGSEGKRGGEFYTPRSVVRTMVEMIQPHDGRVYDPCCGSGGMFVQSEKFVENHGGRIGDIAIYGQESNHTTWRLCMMNLAVRGIDGDIKWNSEGSFHKDELPDLRADYVLANTNAISTVEMLQALIELAKEIREKIAQGEEDGLSAEEVAFYEALADNESAVDIMGNDSLKVIAAELVKGLKANASVDWAHRESARARMRVLVKRILRKYGYPPDLQDAAVQTVIQQAELLASKW